MRNTPSSRRRALLVSWLFPPHASIGAKRAYRFARDLPASGWECTVLCGREPPARLRDGSEWPLPAGVRVVPDYDAHWVTSLANRADARAHAPGADAKDENDSPAPSLARSMLARMRSAAGDLVHDSLPTETIAVHLPHAIRTARALAGAERPDVVWTTSYPYSAHWIGVALKREFGIPFVADLRDPWTLNFVHDGKLPHARWVERQLEKHVFAHADRITVTTDALADAYRAVYPMWADRFVTIRNAFDPDNSHEMIGGGPNRPIRMVHFGHVYGARTLAPIYAAIEILRRRGIALDGEVVIENYGRLSDADRARVDAGGLGGVIRVEDPVPFTDGLARLRTADLLLLPAWGSDRGALFLPGKLYDYLRAGVPILATGTNPELARILDSTRTGRLFAPEDTQGIAAMIAGAIASTLEFRSDPAAIASFTSAGAARRLADLFDSLR